MLYSLVNKLFNVYADRVAPEKAFNLNAFRTSFQVFDRGIKMHTASAICLIQQSIRYKNYKSLMDELGASWGNLGTYSNNEEALKNADESFYKDLKPVLDSLQGLDASDYSIMTMLIQQYLQEHPVRSALVKMAIEQRILEELAKPIRMEVTETMLANFMPADDSIVRKISF